MQEALEIVLDVKTHPLMVMCSSGIHRTGVLVGCLRRLQHWSLSSTISEVFSCTAYVCAVMMSVGVRWWRCCCVPGRNHHGFPPFRSYDMYP